jgi:hypothetical protein
MPLCGWTAEWSFSEPLTLADAGSERVFHHLESSGRRNIAVSDDSVAVTWEDDRDGTPRVYLAVKQVDDDRFPDALRISGDGEAYEPAIAGLPGQRFLLAWEEDGQVMAAVVAANGRGPVLQLSEHAAGQPSVASLGDTHVVVWTERGGRHGQIRMAALAVTGDNGLSIGQVCDVDNQPAADEQSYAAVSLLGSEVIVAWEDRRPGHTIILAAHGKPCQLSEPRRISEAIEQRSAVYGKGHGVARVALAGYGGDQLLAVWADKRDFREGYDIYAASYRSGQGFDANQRVQDDFGGVARQWHPTVTGHADGRLLVAWTDEREGTADILLSEYRDGEWSDDLALPGASGPGQQSQPSMVLDDAGRLHIAWVERDAPDATTRVRYITGINVASD